MPEEAYIYTYNIAGSIAFERGDNTKKKQIQAIREDFEKPVKDGVTIFHIDQHTDGVMKIDVILEAMQDVAWNPETQLHFHAFDCVIEIPYELRTTQLVNVDNSVIVRDYSTMTDEEELAEQEEVKHSPETAAEVKYGLEQMDKLFKEMNLTNVKEIMFNPWNMGDCAPPLEKHRDIIDPMVQYLQKQEVEMTGCFPISLNVFEQYENSINQ